MLKSEKHGITVTGSEAHRRKFRNSSVGRFVNSLRAFVSRSQRPYLLPLMIIIARELCEKRLESTAGERRRIGFVPA
jgi:hypothetical protein